jgi:GNAT superfamily N-acetyltransferase
MIRKATSGDVFDIAETHVLSWRNTYKGMVPDDYLEGLSIPVLAERWAERLFSSVGATFVAEQHDRVVGFADFGPCRDNDKDPHRAGELYAIYLRPEAKGAGAGRLLFAQGQEWLGKRGFLELTTLVLDANQNARDFYLRMGMIQDKVRIPAQLGGQGILEVRYSMKLAQ